MEVPLELGFDGVESSEWMEADIRKRVEKLDALYSRLIACRVRVIAPHKQHRTGNIPTVHIEMSVPGKNLVVSHAPHHPERKGSTEAASIQTVIQDAFKAAERQLTEFKRQIGGEVKRHEVGLHGQVSQMRPGQDHGFLLTNTGSQLYFHRNSVIGADFASLKRGDPVEYVETAGDTGPTASKVWLTSGSAPE